MMKRNVSRRLPQIALVAMFLFIFSSPNVHSFQTHQTPRIRLSTQHTPIATPYDDRLKYTKSALFQSQSVEEDFRIVGMDENQTAVATTTKKWPCLSWRTWGQIVRVDKKQIAELGISFMLTYNLVSNVNGSIFLSLAWYITSIRTGLSPLAAGQWKVLLGTYAGLYVFNTLFRPLRLALALALTKRVAHVLDRTQERFGCSKPAAGAIVFLAMLAFWATCATCGITLASTVAGVPIWKGI